MASYCHLAHSFCPLVLAHSFHSHKLWSPYPALAHSHGILPCHLQNLALLLLAHPTHFHNLSIPFSLSWQLFFWPLALIKNAQLKKLANHQIGEKQIRTEVGILYVCIYIYICRERGGDILIVTHT